MFSSQVTGTASAKVATSKSVTQVGFWAAALTTAWIIAFSVTAIAGNFGVSVPATIVVGSALLIAPCFLVMMVSIHHCTPVEKQIWSQIALSFSIIYTVIVALNYFLQLTVVQQNPQEYDWLALAFQADSAFFALEILGYASMSLAALFVAPSFARGKIETVIRWLFIVNGTVNVVADVVYLMTADPLHPIVLASLGVWSVTFPIATGLLAVLFGHIEQLPPPYR